jgi:outer membrane protein TolC
MQKIKLPLLIALTVASYAQTLTLDECYALAEKNYPMVQQRELIARSAEYTIQNLSTGYLPQVSINGQATYQSDVTKVPVRIPGNSIPVLSKDQYKLYAEVNQTIYDGGVIRQQKESQEASAMIEQQKLEVELYKIRERINQLFFGVLLADEQLKQTQLLKNDIQLGIHKTEGALANGAAFKASLDMLKAELLKANQRSTELNALRSAYLDMLGLFLNQELTAQTTLTTPEAPGIPNEVKRPEMLMYDHQARSFEVQNKMIAARNRPRLGFFVQGGYGRPALNMLSNDFKSYYIGGLRLNWSLSGLYNLRRDHALIDVSRRNIDIQRETFVFNTNFTAKQQNAEVKKYSDLLASDDEIVALRNSVKKTASVQLENGVINSNDYLREVNAEDQARQNKIIHGIQWLMAQYALQTTMGNTN